MKQIDNYILEKLHIGANWKNSVSVDDIIDFLNPPKDYEDKFRDELKKWIENNNIESYGYYIQSNDAKRFSKNIPTHNLIGIYNSIDDKSLGAPDLEPYYKMLLKKSKTNYKNFISTSHEKNWFMFDCIGWNGPVFIKGNWEND